MSTITIRPIIPLNSPVVDSNSKMTSAWSFWFQAMLQQLPAPGMQPVLTFNNRTGNVVLLSSDVTGALGYVPPTPTGGGASGLWGISITGNAATVTTNANLTGPVTSVGNATSIASGALSTTVIGGTPTLIPYFDATGFMGTDSGFTFNDTTKALTATSFNSITALSSTTPVMDGIAAIGITTAVARADHVHPSDTSRALLAGSGTQAFNTATLTATGVTFGDVGGTNDILSHYQEGTWTPTVSSAVGTITTLGTLSGHYTRIGRLINISFSISITNNGSGSSAIYIAGIPFNPSTASISTSVGTCRENAVVGKQVQVWFTSSTTLELVNYDNTYPGGTGYILLGSINYFI